MKDELKRMKRVLKKMGFIDADNVIQPKVILCPFELHSLTFYLPYTSFGLMLLPMGILHSPMLPWLSWLS